MPTLRLHSAAHSFRIQSGTGSDFLEILRAEELAGFLIAIGGIPDRLVDDAAPKHDLPEVIAIRGKLVLELVNDGLHQDRQGFASQPYLGSVRFGHLVTSKAREARPDRRRAGWNLHCIKP